MHDCRFVVLFLYFDGGFVMSTPEGNQTASLDAILADWEGKGIRNVLFVLPDMHGVAREKIVPINKVRGFA